MADHNLNDLLTDFQNLAEAEHHGFIDRLISRHDNAATIFAALAFFEVWQIIIFAFCGSQFIFFRTNQSLTPSSSRCVISSLQFTG